MEALDVNHLVLGVGAVVDPPMYEQGSHASFFGWGLSTKVNISKFFLQPIDMDASWETGGEAHRSENDRLYGFYHVMTDRALPSSGYLRRRTQPSFHTILSQDGQHAWHIC